MEKPVLTRLCGFFLALAVILGGCTIYYARRCGTQARLSEARQAQGLSSLLHSLEHIETALEKARYLPTGALRQTLAADVWKESQTASTALAAIPLDDRRLESVETYIAQVGDYAYYLLRNAAYKRSDDAEWATFVSLRDNAAEMLTQISALKAAADTGSLSLSTEASSADADGLGQRLTAVNDEFPEYASLIYDGPYSDHIAQRTPLALEGQRELTQEKALEKAAALLAAAPAQVKQEYHSQGQIPCYGFSCGTVSCAISVQGGLAISLSDSREPGMAMLSVSEAVEQAQFFLNTIGLTQMTPSYHTIFEGVCTINFAFVENDIIAYPDLVKVGVALDDGSIVRLDASGYAMNHRQRTTAEPAFSIEEAQACLPDTLTMENAHLAYIPTTGQNEVLCWELVCRTDTGGQALLYFNIQTGQVENLLLLIESETGTLTR